MSVRDAPAVSVDPRRLSHADTDHLLALRTDEHVLGVDRVELPPVYLGQSLFSVWTQRLVVGLFGSEPWWHANLLFLF